MSATKDGCRQNGASVRTRAASVPSISECKSRFGTNFNSEIVTGVVRGEIVPPTALLDVDRFFGSEIMLKFLNNCNVRECELENGPPRPICDTLNTKREQTDLT